MQDQIHSDRGLRYTLRVLDEQRTQFTVERVSDGHLLCSRLLTSEAVEHFDAIVESWICERLGVDEPAPVPCSACGEILKAEGRTDTEHQFTNALWITFSGGYGMFIDPCDRDTTRAVLCHECAHALCAQHPWIDAVVEPLLGHAHGEDGPALILAGHDGWDLTPNRLDGGPLLESHLTVIHHVKELPGTTVDRWALHHRLHRTDSSHHHYDTRSGGVAEQADSR
jgi:hypothetical protein